LFQGKVVPEQSRFTENKNVLIKQLPSGEGRVIFQLVFLRRLRAAARHNASPLSQRPIRSPIFDRLDAGEQRVMGVAMTARNLHFERVDGPEYERYCVWEGPRLVATVIGYSLTGDTAVLDQLRAMKKPNESVLDFIKRMPEEAQFAGLSGAGRS
jgi:hypothetical protein